MSLASLKYFLFLSLSLLAFHLFKKYQKVVIAISSMTFFGLYDQLSLSVLVFASLVTYWSFKKEKTSVGIYTNLILLVVHHLLIASWTGEALIPLLGISFFTLQNIAFLKENKNPIDFLDYFVLSSFFPKQLSGPILRFNSEERFFGKVQWKSGFERILLGLFKKLVIADRLDDLVDSVLLHPVDNPGLTQYTATLLFLVQLYFDFSAFVDIAIGSGKLFGIKLPENFNLPLRSKSLSEFWRKWHMTLMQWLVDFIYYPLSYRFRKSNLLVFTLPILLVFITSGLWSGFEVKYLITVSFFAIIIIIEHFLKPFKPKGKWWNIPSWIISIHLLAFGFLFFGTKSEEDVFAILASIFKNFIPIDFYGQFVAPLANGAHLNDQFNLALTLLLVALSLLFEKRLNRDNWSPVKLITIGISLLLFANWEKTTQFIYMQF